MVFEVELIGLQEPYEVVELRVAIYPMSSPFDKQVWKFTPSFTDEYGNPVEDVELTDSNGNVITEIVAIQTFHISLNEIISLNISYSL